MKHILDYFDRKTVDLTFDEKVHLYVCWTQGSWAITEKHGVWVIIHHPSVSAIDYIFKELEQAAEFVCLVNESGIDWDFPDPDSSVPFNKIFEDAAKTCSGARIPQALVRTIAVRS